MSRTPHLAALLLAAIIGATIATAQQPPSETTPAAKPDEKPSAPKKSVYDERADAKSDIAAALERAKRENRRVLLQWGGNWCPWCIKLHELFANDPKIAKLLTYEYDVVYVDTSRPPDKNQELVEKYGADVKKSGYPYLTILDADGRPIVNQETAALETNGDIAAGHNPSKVVAFLTLNQAPPQNATKALDSALADAKVTDRRVFIHYGAPWCPWCHRLDDWLRSEPVAKLLAKDFVVLKIDIDRMTGGRKVLTRVKGDDQGGIPWFAFLTPDGQPLITSDDPKIGNIGFPYKPEEIAHFEAMLKKAANRMTPDDIAAVVKTMGEETN